MSCFPPPPVDLVSEIVSAGEFGVSNQDSTLCPMVVTNDDSIVEESEVFTLQLVSGVSGDRFLVQPSISTVTVLDNDSRFLFCWWIKMLLMYQQL